MKRLNPETGKPFKQGDTREDGFLFWGYEPHVKKDGYRYEDWFSPEKFNANLERKRDWHRRNKERFANYASGWKKDNKPKVNASTAKRRSAKLNATPAWLTQEHLQQIESVYVLAQQLTIDTGIVHHVDHIVPLQGELVSGLHVPWNLRAIPAAENLNKGKSFDVHKQSDLCCSITEPD